MKNNAKQKRYYEKKRNDTNFKEKERLRQKKLRDTKAITMTKKEKKKQIEAARERQRKCRAAKKLNTSIKFSSLNTSTLTTSKESPYRIPQTLGKAVKKTWNALPTSPRKRMVVVNNLVKKVGLKLQKERETNVSDDNLNKELVAEFLGRTDIVYTAPGMHDEMTIWENGMKKRVCKLYLTMYMKEALALFKEENPSINIGYSKFCSLRPKNVLLVKDTPSDHCKCKSHENFILLLKGLNINYNNDFWKEILCNSDSGSECWETNCDKCNAGELLLGFIGKKGLNNTFNVQWHQWVQSENKRFFKETNDGCAAELNDNVLANFQATRFKWKYSAICHGKGVVDGIGGTAKSRVYAEVKARRAIVQNAIDFATVAAEVVPNITVISMLQNDIDETHINWNLAKDVPRIKKAHIVKSSDDHICLPANKIRIFLYKSYAIVKIQISISKVPNHLQKITLHL
ncbi:hypothetical protein AVEN_8634-2 [Araneus ventricosus]|nr:hypothetical protein AVEN_8634-2 [Araneus ventricosus]